MEHAGDAGSAREHKILRAVSRKQAVEPRAAVTSISERHLRLDEPRLRSAQTLGLWNHQGALMTQRSDTGTTRGPGGVEVAEIPWPALQILVVWKAGFRTKRPWCCDFRCAFRVQQPRPNTTDGVPTVPQTPLGYPPGLIKTRSGRLALRIVAHLVGDYCPKDEINTGIYGDIQFWRAANRATLPQRGSTKPKAEAPG